MKLIMKSVAIMLLLASAPAAASAPPIAKPLSSGDYYRTLVTADKAYTASDYHTAATLLRQLADQNTLDSKVWWRLGYAEYQNGDYREAAQALEKAASLGGWFQQRTAYQLAKTYAQLGDASRAMSWLRVALFRERHERRDDVLSDEAFKSLAGNPDFQRLRAPFGDHFNDRVVGWRADLDYLVGEVKRLNIRYSREPLPPAFVSGVDDLRKQIPELTDPQIAVRMQELMAVLGQTHNGLWLGSGESRVPFRRLPVAFYPFSDGIFVVDADPDHRQLIGAEVVAFDKTSAADALAAMARLINHENDVEIVWLAPAPLSTPAILQALGLTARTDQVDLTLRAPDGSTRVVPLRESDFHPGRKMIPSQITATPPPLYLSNVADSYWFQPLSADMLYFQFNQVFDKEGETIEAFAGRLNSYILAHPRIRNVIVDLRHNNGGNTYSYPKLIQSLAAFDARPNSMIYAIIGRNTYSAAENFTVDLERFTDAVFVGERSGGKPDSFGDESPTTLPYSRIEGGLSAVYWQLSSPRDDRKWISPQVPVELSSRDYFANRDPAMTAVLGLIHSR